MSFKINCPHCGQKLEAENEHVGLEVPCPSCSRNILIQVKSTKEVTATNITPLKKPSHLSLNPGDKKKYTFKNVLLGCGGLSILVIILIFVILIISVIISSHGIGIPYQTIIKNINIYNEETITMVNGDRKTTAEFNSGLGSIEIIGLKNDPKSVFMCCGLQNEDKAALLLSISCAILLIKNILPNLPEKEIQDWVTNVIKTGAEQNQASKDSRNYEGKVFVVNFQPILSWLTVSIKPEGMEKK